MRRIRRQVIPGFGPEQMRAARAQLGLSQEELAKRAGIPFRTYRSWENGESEPQAAKITPLLRFLEAEGIDPQRVAVRSPLEQHILDDPGLTIEDKAKLIRALRGMGED